MRDVSYKRTNTDKSITPDTAPSNIHLRDRELHSGCWVGAGELLSQ